MKKTPARIESLAAEYVLGSLRGPARRRFEQWMMESYEVRQEVWFWEQKLGQLASTVPEQEPPKAVWQQIEQRLWPQTHKQAHPSQARHWFWPGLSALATAAALVLAVLLVQPTDPVTDDPRGLSGAIVQQDVNEPLWLINEAVSERRLRLRPVAAIQADADKDYELWIVPQEGQPLSLGVIPVGDNLFQVTLSDAQREALLNSRTLAISLEPRGGSTTGAPTGPILHTTQLYEL